MLGDLFLVSRVPDKWCKIPLKPPPPAWLLGAEPLLFPCQWMFYMVTHNSPNIGQRDSHKEWTKIMHTLDILTRNKCKTCIYILEKNIFNTNLFILDSMWLFKGLRFTILRINSFTTSLKICINGCKPWNGIENVRRNRHRDQFDNFISKHINKTPLSKAGLKDESSRISVVLPGFG